VPYNVAYQKRKLHNQKFILDKKIAIIFVEYIQSERQRRKVQLSHLWFYPCKCCRFLAL